MGRDPAALPVPRHELPRHRRLRPARASPSPTRAIYRLLLERNGLDPAACIFIDDSAKNVAGAAALGIDAVLFTTPEALHDALAARGLLSPRAETA